METYDFQHIISNQNPKFYSNQAFNLNDCEKFLNYLNLHTISTIEHNKSLQFLAILIKISKVITCCMPNISSNLILMVFKNVKLLQLSDQKFSFEIIKNKLFRIKLLYP